MSAAPPSTHTDEQGNVIKVYNDGDNGVYKHKGKDASASEEVAKNYSKTNTSAGGTKMGETEYWNEFIDVDSNTIPAGTKILFGQNWTSTINKYIDKAKDMGLKEIAANSTVNSPLDLKNQKEDAPNGFLTGKLFNGKYTSARSIGNYLAGYFGATHSFYGYSVTKNQYMGLAGALQTKDWDGHGKGKAFMILEFGVRYGDAPYYGEIEYSGRMISKGYDAGLSTYSPLDRYIKFNGQQ
jgi:hypothetical protein